MKYLVIVQKYAEILLGYAEVALIAVLNYIVRKIKNIIGRLIRLLIDYLKFLVFFFEDYVYDFVNFVTRHYNKRWPQIKSAYRYSIYVYKTVVVYVFRMYVEVICSFEVTKYFLHFRDNMVDFYKHNRQSLVTLCTIMYVFFAINLVTTGPQQSPILILFFIVLILFSRSIMPRHRIDNLIYTNWKVFIFLIAVSITVSYIICS